jgi:hypothetical protein
MTALDMVKLAGAILGSIGGAGAIIFGLSGFFGKLWADRALEDHRQKYNQLNMQMQHDLDNASKRLQLELDTLGLVHSLRTKEEFSRLSALWKRFANLTFAFHEMSSPGLVVVPAHEEEGKRYIAKLSEDFEAALRDAQNFFAEEMIFIPEPIVKAAQDTIYPALRVPYLEIIHESGGRKAALWKALEQYDSGLRRLEQLIRQHIRGEKLDSAEIRNASSTEHNPAPDGRAERNNGTTA